MLFQRLRNVDEASKAHLRMPLCTDAAIGGQTNELVCASKVGHFIDFYGKGLIPHPSKKASFWGMHPVGVSNAVLQLKRLTDPESCEMLKKLDSAERGSTVPLPRVIALTLSPDSISLSLVGVLERMINIGSTRDHLKGGLCSRST